MQIFCQATQAIDCNIESLGIKPVNDAPLVSIIMPHYRHPHFLLEAVESVSELDYPAIELVIVDDCSPPPDGAREALANIAPKHFPINIIEHEQNAGYVIVKNTALKHAKGEFILPLDNDDKLDPSYLKKTLPLFADSEVGLVLTDVQFFGDQTSVYTPAHKPIDLVNLQTPSNTFLVRRAVYDSIGVYDSTLRFGDETDFLLRVLESKWKIAHVAEPLYFYRKHEGGCSKNTSYAALLKCLIERHPNTFKTHLREALLFREERYWGEMESSQPGSHLGTVIHRQYQHLHSEFHKLLKLYEDQQKETKRLNRTLEQMGNTKYHRLRSGVQRVLEAVKR